MIVNHDSYKKLLQIIMRIFISSILICTLFAIEFKINSFQELLQIWRQYLQQDLRLTQWKYPFQNFNHQYNDCNSICQYPIFEFKDFDSQKQVYPIVFLVASFHGIQKLGSQILTYSFPFIEAKHIIFLPVANPSGYIHNIRQQYPLWVDPNGDFPYNVLPSTSCMKGVTSKIIDYIYRRWQIDITVTFHSGASEIGWNWRSRNQLTQDNQISFDIANSLQVYAGQNKAIGMKKLNIQNEYNKKYPVYGSFQDWAYAASWNQRFVSKCQYYNYDPYPINMTKGLVFMIYAGPIDSKLTHLGYQEGLNLNPNAYSFSNGYITRGIRIIKKLLQIIYPKLNYSVSKENFVIQVIGCNQTKLSITINNKKYELYVYGSMNLHPTPVTIPFSQINPQNSAKFTLQYNMKCDKNWKSKGHTIFSKGREYSGNKIIVIQQLPHFDRQNSEIQNLRNYTVAQYIILISIGIWMIGILLLILHSIFKESKSANKELIVQNMQNVRFQEASQKQMNQNDKNQV